MIENVFILTMLLGPPRSQLANIDEDHLQGYDVNSHVHLSKAFDHARVRVDDSWRKRLHTSQVAHQAGAYLGFVSWSV